MISRALSLSHFYRRLKSEFSAMEIKQHTYTAILDSFTPKTYILIVSTSESVHDMAKIKQAVEKAKPVFANLPGVSLGGR